jgi:hypothetical protein
MTVTIDRNSWWWQKGVALLVIAGASLGAGMVSTPLLEPAWREMRSRQPELKLQDLGDNVSQGMMLGLFGGFRTIIADFVCIRTYTYWEHHDLPNTEAMIELFTRLDPGTIFFWDIGEQMIGFDIPYWRIHYIEHTTEDTPEGKAIWREQAERALALLDRGLQYHPGNRKLLIDKEQIYELRLHDPAKAAEQYRLIAEDPTSDYFFAREYAEMLVQMHRYREAYDYLRKIYPTLPADKPQAAKGVVWERLRALEKALKLPPDQCLPDSAQPPGWKPGDDPDDLGALP